MTNSTRLAGSWSAFGLAAAGMLLLGCSEPVAGPSFTDSGGLGQGTRLVVSGRVTDTRDAPIDGAIVTLLRTPSRTTVTDGAGRFTIETVEIGPSDMVTLSANKDGYLTGRSTGAAEALRTVAITIKLSPMLQLPVDGSTTSELLTADPYGYVGEPYDSDYSWNTRYYAFTTPGTDDVLVEVRWERVGNAALRMWALDGAIASEPSGDGEVLRLPRGTTGVLQVGQRYSAGKLTEPAAFTLVTRRVSVSSQLGHR